jgi:DNA-directed RNA polymerase specialized sigma24 family protein
MERTDDPTVPRRVQTPPPEDLRFTRTDELARHFREYARMHANELLVYNMDPEDFAQEVWVNVLRRDPAVFQHFDARRCRGGLKGLCFTVCRNHLCDLREKHGSKKRRTFHGERVWIHSLYEPCSLKPPHERTTGRMLCDVLLQQFPDAEPYFTSTDLSLALMEMRDAVGEAGCLPDRAMTWETFLNLLIEHDAGEQLEAAFEEAARALGDEPLKTSRLYQLRRHLAGLALLEGRSVGRAKKRAAAQG